MRCDPDLDRLVPARVLVVEGEHGVEPLGPGAEVLPAGRVDDAGRDHAAQAGHQDGVEDRLLERVHLAGRRDAEPQQLGAGERHPPEDVVARQPRLARPEDLAQEAVEVDVLRRAAEERHRRMAVDVDETGHEEALDALLIALGRADAHDPPVDRLDRARPVDGHRLVAGNDGVGR